MSLPALPVAVLAVLDLRVLDAVGVAPALLGAGVLVHDAARHRRHARDARLGEQPLVLLELPVPLVRTHVGLRGGQVPAKSGDKLERGKGVAWAIGRALTNV